MKKFIMILMLGLLMTGCSLKIIEDNKEDVPYPDSTEILYKQDIEKGTIVLYRD